MKIPVPLLDTLYKRELFACQDFFTQRLFTACRTETQPIRLSPLFSPLTGKEAEITAIQYVKAARRKIAFDKAVLFGSYITGKYDQDSDVDIGLFVENLDRNIDYLDLMSQLYHLAAEINARIEPHLFIRNEDQSGFAQMVERTGQRLPV